MKKLLALILPLLLLSALRAQTASSPIALSVADLLPNYGLDSAIVNDTAGAIAYLDRQQQDFAALTNLCVLLRTNAQKAIASFENDYTRRDSLIWIDTHIVVVDYGLYEPRLRTFADLMGRLSINYSRLEQERVEAEKEAARQRAIDEQRRQQDERNAQASDIKANIDLHHRSIIAACDGQGITDKVRLKDLKDLYYSYLMVYNKYDLSTLNASERTLVQLNELNDFQLDLLEKILGNNALPTQIENFRNQLKTRCEKDNTDVYRSYSRVFKNTSVPISFADLKEYEDYIKRLNTIIAVQQRYMQAIDLRSTITQNSDNIQRLYSKKYRDVANAYKETSRSLNTVPAFTTNAESLRFIRELEDFIGAQRVYLSSYDILEDISHRSDTIIAVSQSAYRDIAAAYRELRPTLLPVPNFRTPDEADNYLSQLELVQHIQRQYLSVISLRDTIRLNQDSINAQRRVDRILWSGYRNLQEQAALTPAFTNVDRGNAFILALRDHVDIQRLVLRSFDLRRTAADNVSRITGKANIHRNIAKAYLRMEKAYEGISDILSLDDLRRYNRQCSAVLVMQQAFLDLLASEHAADTDNLLRRETDISKIRIALGL